ncbi:hypothetical protein [Bacillus tropicus]|uniref:hypothetical protein n=1 Tax=Bacillus tropicus TaxID=2026188 RepID=UPI000BF66DCC|nr:hypothetical protein CN415_24675 [Bacillus cereus]
MMPIVYSEEISIIDDSFTYTSSMVQDARNAKIRGIQNQFQRYHRVKLDRELAKRSGRYTEEHSYYFDSEYLSETGKNVEFSGYPILRDLNKKEVSEQMENKDDIVVSKAIEENLKKILEANLNSNRLMFKNVEEKREFLQRCEKVYKKTTREHLRQFEERGFEGNVEERKWYRLAKKLIDEGIEI